MVFLNFWKRLHPLKVILAEAKNKDRQDHATTASLCEYRKTFTEDQLRLKFYMGWVDIHNKERLRRVNLDQQHRNNRSKPRPPRR